MILLSKENKNLEIEKLQCDNIGLDTVYTWKNDIRIIIKFVIRLIYVLIFVLIGVSTILKLVLHFSDVTQVLLWIHKIEGLTLFDNYINCVNDFSVSDFVLSDSLAIVALIISIYTFRFSKIYDLVSQYSDFGIESIDICRTSDFKTESSLIRNDIKNNLASLGDEWLDSYIFELKTKNESIMYMNIRIRDFKIKIYDSTNSFLKEQKTESLKLKDKKYVWKFTEDDKDVFIILFQIKNLKKHWWNKKRFSINIIDEEKFKNTLAKKRKNTRLLIKFKLKFRLEFYNEHVKHPAPVWLNINSSYLDSKLKKINSFITKE